MIWVVTLRMAAKFCSRTFLSWDHKATYGKGAGTRVKAEMGAYGKGGALGDGFRVLSGKVQDPFGIVMGYFMEQGLELLGSGLFRSHPDQFAGIVIL